MSVPLLPDVKRIDLPVRSSRVLLRVELGSDPDEAVRLQHRFTLRTTGSPTLPDIPVTPAFDLERLPGVIVNGWAQPAAVGNYDLDYVARTLITDGGIRANVMPEACTIERRMERANIAS